MMYDTDNIKSDLNRVLIDGLNRQATEDDYFWVDRIHQDELKIKVSCLCMVQRAIDLWGKRMVLDRKEYLSRLIDIYYDCDDMYSVCDFYEDEVDRANQWYDGLEAKNG